jgi:membrane protease YdiL (CAAX protease family)
MDDTLPTVDAPRSRLAWVFTGDDGLRAGWSIVLFFLLAVITVMVLSGALYLLAPSVIRMLHKTKMAMPGPLAVNEVLMLLGVAVPAFIMTFIERRRFVRYNVGGSNRAAAFVKGLVSGLVMLSILVGIIAAIGSITFHGVAIGGGAIPTFGVEWLVVFLLVGLFEEFGFRGYLQFTLARGIAGVARWRGTPPPRAASIGFWVAVVLLSVILFAYVHTMNGGETPMGITAVSLAGFAFAFSLWWTGSLWWAIGFHCAWDWAQSYLFGVADSGLVSQGRLLITTPAGNPLISGGTTGPEGSLLVIPVMLASMVLVWKTMPRGIPPVLDGEA